MLPEIPVPTQSKETVQIFGGYDHNVKIADNEFYDMKNLSSAAYPALSPRERRGIVKKIDECNGLLAKNELAYVDGNTLYYGDFKMSLDETVEGERQLVSMGAYIIVFPDWKYVNTADMNDYGDIYGESKLFGGVDVKLTLLDSNHNAIDINNLHLDMGLNYTAGGLDGVVRNGGFWGKARTVSVDPFVVYTEKTYLEDIVGGTFESCAFPGQERGNEITYEVTANWGRWRHFDLSLYGTVEYDEKGYYFRTKWDQSNTYYDGFRRTLQDHLATSPNDVIDWGVVTVTRKLDGNMMYSRDYKIKINSKTDAVFNINDLRLYQDKDGFSSIQRCKKVMDSPADTWAEATCWEKENTFVEIHIEGSDIGNVITDIIENKSSEKIVIEDTSEPKTATLVGLLKKYDEQNVMLAKNTVTVIDRETVALEGCLNFLTPDDMNTYELGVHLIPKRQELDYVMECGNRLWGCRYGKNNNGDFVNHIYATALGSFSNWDENSAISTDSYSVPVGSDGAFTGAVNYRGQPIFFKENCCHKVYGTYPANYQVTTDTCMGLQKGSHRSLCIIQNVLYYKSADGVYRYDEASYDKISEKLGFVSYNDAVGGSIDNKYYLAMTDTEGKRELLVYDIVKDMWHKEDEVNARYFATYSSDLYFYDLDSRTLCTVKGTVGEKEAQAVRWFAETGHVGYTTLDAKYLSKIQLRISLPVGSSVNFYIEYDSDGYFQHFGSITGRSNQAFTLPLFPRRCDHFRLKLSGEGECKIFSLVKVMESGGDM